MIYLDRKFNQIIRINDEISITVLQFKNGKVKIGIQAPKDTPVMRCKITDYRIPPSQRGGEERRPQSDREQRAIQLRVVSDDDASQRL